MSVSTRYVLHQGAVLQALGRTAFDGLLQAVRPRPAGKRELRLPGAPLCRTLAPLDAGLVRTYLKHVGGDAAAWRGSLPPHLFAHWGFPLAAQTLRGIPYPLSRVLNGGCRLEMHAALPADEPLEVSARLEEVDDDGARAVLHQIIETGTASAPRALVAHLYAIVPYAKASAPSRRKERARVPRDAREIDSWRLPADAGLDFAKLTGDFNPVHWIGAYARASGFRSPILHGFSTLARAFEGVQRARFAGRAHALERFDARFTRPLPLPAKVGLFVDDEGGVWVGDAPGGPAYMTGSYEGEN